MKNILAISLLLTMLILASCKKDEKPVTTPTPPTNEGELITTLKLLFTDSADANVKFHAQFKDPDGDGGNVPTVFDTIKLSANKTYYAKIVLLDETKNPVDTISNEVLEEANEHLFVFKPSAVNLMVSYNDLDSNTPALPLGLSSIWRSGSTSSGKIKVILKHQPGTKNGTEAPGDTDVEIDFPARIVP